MADEQGETNRVEDVINAWHEAGRQGDLEAELARFDPAHLNEAERESWHHMWGIVAYQRGERAEALVRFEVAHAACPESGSIAFSLGQELQEAGEPARMFAIFDQFPYPRVPPTYALAQARFSYLWDRPDKAISYVEPMLGVYYELGIVDDTFLHIRGLPFFTTVWSLLGACHELTGDLERFRAFTKDAGERLSEQPFDKMLDFVEAAISGDFTGVVKSLGDQIDELREMSVPSGYTEMRIGVIESQMAADPHAGLARLAAVTLTERDFPWLEDVRLLARAALLGRIGDESAVAEAHLAFLDRQPLLLEPEHLFNFRLVAAQQPLKPFYQARRQHSPAS